MKTTVLQPDQLTVRHLGAWSRLQNADPLLQSPFLSPEFTLAVAAVRDDVEVAVWQDGDEFAGFLPFQRSRRNFGKPVGNGMSECQAVIARDNSRWDARQLLRDCGLRAWEFDHLLASQAPFRSHHARVIASPYLDLSGGFDGFVDSSRQGGSRLVPQVERKKRKLCREKGPVRFELHSTEPAAFDCLLNWKSRQHHQTSVLDVFRFEWVVELLRTVRDTQTAGFAGMLSVLYVADQPVAVHLGARTSTVAHIWYPAFDTTFGKYSPGLVLLTELARALSSLGVRRLDFGPGPQQYKQRFKSGEYPMAIGVVDSHRAAGVARHASRRAKAWVRQSALRGPVRIPAHMLFRFRQWLAFR